MIILSTLSNLPIKYITGFCKVPLIRHGYVMNSTYLRYVRNNNDLHVKCRPGYQLNLVQATSQQKSNITGYKLDLTGAKQKLQKPAMLFTLSCLNDQWSHQVECTKINRIIRTT